MEKDLRMQGIYAALLGASDEEGRVDEKGLAQLVRLNITHCGVDGLYVGGSTGETFLMPLSARVRTIEVAAEAARGECRLIAHIGGNVMEEIRAQAEAAEASGYDAISAVVPFYYKFTPQEILEYYRRIASFSRLPLIAYYIPVLTGVQLDLAQLQAILALDGVAGIKFTSNDFYLLERLREACPEGLLLSGFDEMLLSAAVLGTDGAIGSTYNIIGHWAKHVLNATRAGDLKAARLWQGRMNQVISLLLSAGIYQTLKEVASLYGATIHGCRPPMSPTTDAHRKAAKTIHAYITRFAGDQNPEGF